MLQSTIPFLPLSRQDTVIASPATSASKPSTYTAHEPHPNSKPACNPQTPAPPSSPPPSTLYNLLNLHRRLLPLPLLLGPPQHLRRLPNPLHHNTPPHHPYLAHRLDRLHASLPPPLHLHPHRPIDRHRLHAPSTSRRLLLLSLSACLQRVFVRSTTS